MMIAVVSDFLITPRDTYATSMHIVNACHNVDALLFTGNITSGCDPISVLELVASKLDNRPIYYVFGNTDFYGTSISRLRSASRFVGASNLVHLGDQRSCSLSHGTRLCGTGGWYDLRGEWDLSCQIIDDRHKIEDFNFLGSIMFGSRCVRIAEFEASRLDQGISHALSCLVNNIVVLTHFPPLDTDNHDVGDGALCGAIGDIIVAHAIDNPSVTFTVISGATDKNISEKVLGNVFLKTFPYRSIGMIDI